MTPGADASRLLARALPTRDLAKVAGLRAGGGDRSRDRRAAWAFGGAAAIHGRAEGGDLRDRLVLTPEG